MLLNLSLVATECTTSPKHDAPAKISRGRRSIGSIPSKPAPKGGDQGVISRITGLSRTDTATLLLGVIDVPAALTRGW
jgi:hypothetical protein